MKKLREFKCDECAQTSAFMLEDGESASIHCTFCAIASVSLEQ